MYCRVQETPGWNRIKRVFLDGKLIERVIAFDSEAGWVQHFRMPIAADPWGEPIKEYLFGAEVSWDEFDGESEPNCQSASPETPEPTR